MHCIYRLVLATVLLWSGETFAWGPAGHQSVGYIADRLLAGTTTAKEVRKILDTNLKTASVWADCAKGVNKSPTTGAFHYSVSPFHPECAIFEKSGGPQLMIAYVKRNWDTCHPASDEEVCHKQYHYADVAIERDGYASNIQGTSDHDVVHAINACIIVLQGGKAPAPFDIANKKEALRVLTHLVGDIHQPLHVGAVYLDVNGDLKDPDSGMFDPKTKTTGGNDLLHGSNKMHSEWDGIPTKLTPDKLTDADLDDARDIPITAGSITNWSATWATESIHASKVAFVDVTFSAEDEAAHKWKATEPAGYTNKRQAIQREQLIEAGAQLAQVLKAVFP